MASRTFRVWRGERDGEGGFADYSTDITEGMVVLGRRSPDPGGVGGRSRGPLELQGGQVRFL